MIAGGAGLVALLGGAAAVGRTLLRKETGDTTGAANEIDLVGGASGVPGPGMVRKVFKPQNIKPAPELPSGEPAVSGLYLRRNDNSIYIGTGNVELRVQVDAEHKTSAKASHDGPEAEVVFTRDTVLYEDTTPMTVDDFENSREIQQVVAQVPTLDALTEKLSDVDGLAVWGEKNGDRYIAKVVLYRPPILPK